MSDIKRAKRNAEYLEELHWQPGKGAVAGVEIDQRQTPTMRVSKECIGTRFQ